MPKPASSAKLAFGFILISTSFFACGSSSKASQAELDSLVTSRLGAHYTISYNQANTYALCQQSPSADHMNRSYKFIVVKVIDRTVVNEGSFKNGYVKWIDDRSVEVASGGLDKKTVITVGGQKS
jgi:hypothetical protein